MSQPRLRRHLSVLLLLIVPACAEPEPVGLRSLSVTAELELVDTPVLVLGVIEGDPAQVFDAISGVAFVGDDRIAVGDRSRTIRFFSLDGAHVGTVGGLGQGPAEFQHVRQMLRSTDGGLLAYDSGNRRLKRYDVSGALVEQVVVARPGFESSSGLASVGSDDLVGIAWRALSAAAAGELVRDSATVLLFDELGRRADSIGAVPGRVFLSAGGGTYWEQPMAPRTRITAWEDTFAVTVGDEPEIRLFDRAGRAIDAFSTVREPTRVTPAIRRGFATERREWMRLVGMPESLPFPAIWEGNYPDVLPYYDDLTWGGACLWIQHFPVPGSSTQVWDVVRPGTAYVGRLEIPASYRVRAARGSLLATTTRDSLGVQRVHLLRVAGLSSDCASAGGDL